MTIGCRCVLVGQGFLSHSDVINFTQTARTPLHFGLDRRRQDCAVVKIHRGSPPISSCGCPSWTPFYAKGKVIIPTLSLLSLGSSAYYTEYFGLLKSYSSSTYELGSAFASRCSKYHAGNILPIVKWEE